jgi:thioredoxin reductase
MTENKLYEVIIIGGSYAGLSAAMSLGRSLRNIMVIDSGKPCNRQAPQSHNFLTHDGSKPAEVTALGRKQVQKYETVQFYDDVAVKGLKTDDGFEITTRSGKTFTGKKLIFATGIRDELPEIPGFSSCWGISVIHCPYCHGYEFREQSTAIFANGERAFHLASLVNNLTAHITLLTHGKADFAAEESNKLKQRGIEIVEEKITEIIHENGMVKQVAFYDGAKRSFDAVYAAIPFSQHCDIPAALGCEMNEHGYIQIDHFQKTTVPGVFACGDNTTMMRSLATAVASGSLTGALVNKELTEETF